VSVAALRSDFVTVTAWVLIVACGSVLAFALLQNLLLLFIGGSDAQVESVLRELAKKGRPTSEFTVFALRNAHAILLSCLAMSLMMFAASVGLLLRKDWARLVVIGVLGLFIAVCAAMAIWMTYSWLNVARPAVDGLFITVITGSITTVNILILSGMGALAGWVARRLASASVAQEFA
jgi:hypothetical protein